MKKLLFFSSLAVLTIFISRCAHAQNECPSGSYVPSWGKFTTSDGVTHQTVCIDVNAKWTLPLFTGNLSLNNTILPSTGVYSWNGDTGLSRINADVIGFGNSASLDISGTAIASKFAGGTSIFTPQATFHSKTGSGGADLILEQTIDANEVINTKNTVQSWSFGIRQSSSEAFIFRDATSTNDRLSIPAGSGLMTLPNATDTITGKSTTDTLSNKTLTGANSNNSTTLLNWQQPIVAKTGNSSDQVVYTYTLPANTMQAGKGIRITASATHSTGSATISWKINFGGTSLTTVSITDTAVKLERFELILFNNSGVTNVQNGSVDVVESSGTVEAAALASSAIDTTAGVTITLTFNVANTDQVTGQNFLVELVQ